MFDLPAPAPSLSVAVAGMSDTLKAACQQYNETGQCAEVSAPMSVHDTALPEFWLLVEEQMEGWTLTPRRDPRQRRVEPAPVREKKAGLSVEVREG